MVRKDDFDSTVALPPGLTLVGIRKAIEYLEKELSDLVEIYYEQANVFSALPVAVVARIFGDFGRLDPPILAAYGAGLCDRWSRPR